MSDANELSRRHLLTLSAATSAAVLGVGADAEAKPAQVPRRRLGKTNETIPILLVGGGMGFEGAHKADVGLIAMKTQSSEAGLTNAVHKFEKAGKWNKYQAVLKAVWEDERLAAAVSHMVDVKQLRENIAAAVDRSKLGLNERDAVHRYAEATLAYACDGCQHLCGAAIAAPVRIATTLRCLMYHDSYADPDKARRVFAELPADARRLDGIDFSAASRACPTASISWRRWSARAKCWFESGSRSRLQPGPS